MCFFTVLKFLPPVSAGFSSVVFGHSSTTGYQKVKCLSFVFPCGNLPKGPRGTDNICGTVYVI